MVTSSASSERGKCASTTSVVAGGNKRRHPATDLGEYRPAKRLSPLLNTPKQRKEEKRRILRLSAQKLRETQDPESCLRRSVLVNNTLLRIQRELRDDVTHEAARANCRRYLERRSSDNAPWLQDALTHTYLYSNAHLFEDHVAQWSDSDDRLPVDGGTTTHDRNMRNLLGNSCHVPSVCKTCPVTPQVQLGCCGVDNQSGVGDLHCCHVTALCMETVATDAVTDCVESDRTFEKRDNGSSVTDCYCGNLTEAERLVLGEMDTVFSNIISVLTNS